MVYNVHDKPPIGKTLLFSLQILLSVFTATALIAQVCGVELSGAFFGAGLATLVYGFVTRSESPMFISNSGAFVAPVLTALAAGGYSAVAIGGVTAAAIYILFGFIFSRISVDNLYKFMPRVLIGSITVVIGINLMGFIPGYIGDTGNLGLLIALFTVLVIALASHYLKGALSMFPFLIGTLAGYLVSIPFGLVDFSKFNDIHLIKLPTIAMTQWTGIDPTIILPIVIVFAAFTLSAICECLSDHAALGGIIGTDLYENPGLARIFIGEGVANLATSFCGGLGACSYGEGVAAVGFSKCASTTVTKIAAIMMMALGFLEPVQAFIASIPSCVIGGGTACVLYGFISSSGIKMLKNVDLNEQKNLIICSVVLSLGISGVVLGGATLSVSGTALALIAGIILNLILKDKA
jgi:uracil permease